MRILRQMVPQKRNKTRYNLLDSEGFFASVSVETALRYHLKEGMELPDELLEEMRREDTLKYAKEIGVAYVAYAPRTRREVEQHLARKGIDEKSIEQVCRRWRNIPIWMMPRMCGSLCAAMQSGWGPGQSAASWRKKVCRSR